MSDRGGTDARVSSPYVVTLGETMGLLYNEQPAPLAHVSSMRLGIGGSESNVAIALQRLGVDASWIGRVGTDAVGQRVLRELKAEGVDVRVVVDPEAPTGLMLKERRTTATTYVWYYRAGSAGSRIAPEDVPTELVSGAAILHVTGITPALSAVAHDAVLEAVRVARSHSVPVSFDVNHRSSLWQDRDAARVYRELAGMATIVFAGEEEARMIVRTATDLEGVARAIAALGPTQVVIKLGSAGCVAFIDGLVYEQPAIPVQAIDTVGAGDAFVGGYLAELVEGRTAAERLRTAAEAGAFVCMAIGDWEGLPHRSDLAILDATEPVNR